MVVEGNLTENSFWAWVSVGCEGGGQQWYWPGICTVLMALIVVECGRTENSERGWGFASWIWASSVEQRQMAVVLTGHLHSLTGINGGGGGGIWQRGREWGRDLVSASWCGRMGSSFTITKMGCLYSVSTSHREMVRQEVPGGSACGLVGSAWWGDRKGWETTVETSLLFVIELAADMTAACLCLKLCISHGLINKWI